MKNDTIKHLVLAAGMFAAAAATTHGATVLGVTYSYDNLIELNGFAGKDAPDGTPQALSRKPSGAGWSGITRPK